MKYPGPSIFILIFALSGFSGLIYESIWTHYLKLYLGHASYSQVLVLVIFMGGLAIGSALAARFGRRLSNLILWYGIAEGLIGVFGLSFHQLFVFVQATSIEQIFPAMGSAWSVNMIKWTLASILILPQSILLGATFPLLSAGVIRRFSGDSGKTLATLYFVNSLGASVGILCNTFIFIPSIGLPGAVLLAGVINIALAFMVYGLSRNDRYPHVVESPSQPHNRFPVSSRYLFVIAGFTGLASFMYEIGWIRMLTLVLGGSSHSFEIMLSAFILGLAIGSLWIRTRIQKFHDPLLALGVIQLMMGVFAALTLPLYNYSYEMMNFLQTALNRSESAYTLYSMFSYGLSLFIMLPATICAGTTLPLVTYMLLQKESDDSNIGKVYSWNTVGSIFGIIFAIQLVMPILGLRWVILTGALVDISLGVFIIYNSGVVLGRSRSGALLVLSAVIIVLISPLTRLDPTKMVSGIFRDGLHQFDESSILFSKDGKTSTVVVLERGKTRSLLNNGKPDAAIRTNADKTASIEANDTPKSKLGYTNDEPTMVLLGTLPFVYKPDIRTIANIGLGSGLTAHTILHQENLVKLDTIEIEQAVVEAMVYFRPKVDNVFLDPRSKIIVDDAKTYFAASGEKYDAIVSEPPNPWVSGVSGLFSREFYQNMIRYLADDGVFVQWMHLYEISPELVSSVYFALIESFSYVHFYQISDGDIALVASNRKLEADYGQVFNTKNLRRELERVNIHNAQDLAIRKLGDKQNLDIIFASLNAGPNSDYFPILNSGAAKARFMKSDASGLFRVRTSNVLNFLGQDPELQFKDITSVTAIDHINLYLDINEFYQLFEQYMVGELPMFESSTAEINAKDLAEVLLNCQKTHRNSELREVFSDRVQTITQWSSQFLVSEKQQQILNQVKKCKTNLNEDANTWVDVNLAWTMQEYQKVIELTKGYFEKRDSLGNRLAKQLIILNLASAIVSGENSGLEGYFDKITPALLTDLELSGLLIVNERLGLVPRLDGNQP